MHRCELQIIMDKLIAFFISSIQNKMDMGIHKAKCQNSYFVFAPNYKYSIHPLLEIVSVIKDSVNRITVSAKMPTIPDWIILTLDKGSID